MSNRFCTKGEKKLNEWTKNQGGRRRNFHLQLAHASKASKFGGNCTGELITGEISA
jgi:hypothetical protein